MTKNELLREIEIAIDAPPESLKGPERLDEVQGWDSLATIMFIALVDEKLGLVVEGEALANAETIDDVVALAGAGLEDHKRAA